MYKIKSLTFKSILISTIRGLSVSVLASIILSIVLALILYTTNDPLNYIKPAIISTIFISFISGSLISSANSPSPSVCASIFVISQAFIMLISALILPTGDLDFNITTAIITYSGASILSIGIIWAKNKLKSNKKRSRPKKYRQ